MIPLDQSGLKQCRRIAARQEEKMRLDYELVRALKCAELQQKGFMIHPKSPFYTMCSDIVSIDVLTTNDIHGVINQQTAYFMNPEYPPNIVGGAAFYKYVHDLKKDDADNLLILDAGNFFQGSNFGMYDKGSSMIEWMNKVGYNAIVPGNNDFLFGVQNLIDLSVKADFDFLASNLYFSNFYNSSENLNFHLEIKKLFFYLIFSMI